VRAGRSAGKENMIRAVVVIFIIAFLIWAIPGCGDKQKTPEDIKTTVAFLDARQALPNFPFGTKPIYMFFNADWCSYCRRMKYDIFERPEIIKYMNRNFTCISVVPDSLDRIFFLGDTVTVAEFKKAFELEAYPSHYFFDKTGQIQGVRTGYIPLLQFKQLLKYVASGEIKKYDFETYLSKPESKMDTVWGKF
jgi:thioredoxin-related protein